VELGLGAPVEVEWQFDAIDLRPVERWLLGAGGDGSGPAGASVGVSARPAQHLVDRYVDTAEWRLGGSGYVLRARRKGRTWEATLKDRAPADDGLRRRLEVTQPLPGGAIEQLDPAGDVGRRVSALVGRRPLVPVMEVRTRRRPFDLRLDGAVVAEVALDETAIDLGPGQEPLRLRRVEVEVDAARAEDLAPLVERLRRECGLQAATLSKFEAGLLAAGTEVPAPADLGPAALGEDPSLGDIAFVALRRSFASMLAHEPGTRIAEDPEELHDMRVSTRRLRAALAQFAPALPVRARHWREELGWLADVLGTARDLDVQMEQLAQWSADAPEADRAALRELGSLLEAHREAAHAQLLAALDGARYGRLVSGFGEMLRRGWSNRFPAARARALDALPESIGALHASARKAARRAERSAQPADYHRLRIRCKKLRYALEFASDVYPVETGRYRRQLVGLQDVLGKLQDAQVASARLRELASGSGPEALPAAAVFVMGGVFERYQRETARILRQLPDRLGLVGGAEWKQLVEAMERRREPAAHSLSPRRSS
jgi:CHAD domain-containing protein